MADDNFLMQFGIDVSVLNAGQALRQVGAITDELAKMGSAAKQLAAARDVEAFFKALQAGATLTKTQLTQVQKALADFGRIKLEATQQVENLNRIDKALSGVAQSARRANDSLQSISKARSFQGLDGVARNLDANSKKLNAFTKDLRAAKKANAEVSLANFPSALLPGKAGIANGQGGRARLTAELAAAESGATDAASRRVAVYEKLNGLAGEIASRMAKLAASPEVQAANRLASQFSNAVRAAKDLNAEMQVLIDRSKRVKVDAGTAGGLVNSRVLFSPTLLPRMKQDPGTVAYFKLLGEQSKALAEELGSASKAAGGVEKALNTLSKSRAQAGMREVAVDTRAAANEFRVFKEQIDAAAKSGELLNFTKMAIPTSIAAANPQARMQKLQADLAAAPAAAGASSKAGAAEAQYRVITQYLKEESALLDGINKKTEDEVRGANRVREAHSGDVQAIRRGTEAQQQMVAAQARSGRALRELQGHQFGNFYPLIIATGIWTGLARAMGGVDVAAIKAAGSQQQAFQSVARTANTTGNAKVQVEGIRLALQQLSTQTPLTFEDLSKIATAGNELGLSAEQIPKFSKLVAEYSKVTGTSVDDATKSFGGLAVVLDLPTSKLENFGSAVSLAGRKSAASEPEVLKMTSRIGSTAHQAGFAIPQIVGLGAALASVKEPAERSQGALEKYFSVTGKAATEGGAKWKAFSEIAGFFGNTKLAKQTYDLDPYAFFRRFIAGLGQIRAAAKAQGKDGFGVTEAITSALNSTGLGADKRVKEVFQRMSGTGAQNELDKDVHNASKGFADGTDLAKQYAVQVNNVADQFKELQNALANFLATFGSAPLSGVGVLVDGLKQVVIWLTQFAALNPFWAKFAFAVIAAATAFAIYKAAAFTAAIATYGLEAAQLRIGATSTLSSMTKMINLLFGLNLGGRTAAASLAAAGVGSTTAAAGFTFSAASAAKLAGTLETTDVVAAGTGEGMALLERGGIVAGAGLAVASKEAMYLADQLVAANIGITSTADALRLLRDAEIVSGEGAVVAEVGAIGLGAGLRAAAASAGALVVRLLPLAVLTYLSFWLMDAGGTAIATANAFSNFIPVLDFFITVGIASSRIALGLANALVVLLQVAAGFGNLDPSVRGFFDNLHKSIQSAADRSSKALDNVDAGVRKDIENWKKWGKAKQAASDSGDIAKFEKQARAEMDKMLKAQKAAGAGTDDYKAKEKALKDEIALLESEMPGATDATNKNTDANKKAAKAAEDAAKAFRTYVDYAQDLGGVMGRAFDIQFGPQQAQDQIAKSFNDMHKNADDATKSIADARKQIQGINADIAQLQASNLQQGYFLGVANAFGDRAASASIQAQMSKNNADIADKQGSKADQYKQIDDAFAQLDNATVGNTDAALRNREALTGLVSNYQDYITKLAASGVSQKVLTQKVKEARADFLSQAEALGFSKKQLEPYSKAMKGFSDIVAKVPRNVTVTAKANTKPAELALAEFFGKKTVDAAATAAQKMNQSLNTIGNGMDASLQKRIDKLNDELDKLQNKNKNRHLKIPGPEYGKPKGLENAVLGTDLSQLGLANARLKAALNGGASERELTNLMNDIKSLANRYGDDRRKAGLSFSSGGYTGPGGKYQPAGIVHKGEYVVPKYMVNQVTGLPYADALGRLVAGTRPQSGYAAGGFVSGDGMMVELGPRSMRVLRDAVMQELSPVIEPRAIAGASNDYTSQQRRRGSSR